jgi:hypothetical protein
LMVCFIKLRTIPRKPDDLNHDCIGIYNDTEIDRFSELHFTAL